MIAIVFFLRKPFVLKASTADFNTRSKMEEFILNMLVMFVGQNDEDHSLSLRMTRTKILFKVNLVCTQSQSQPI